MKQNINIKKLLINLSALKSQSTSLKPVVLMLGGVFNPIHKQHIDTLEIAKKKIEAKDSNIKVVGGFISPCSDIYAKKKLKELAINIDQRLAMIRFAVEDSEWIDINDWEAKHPDNQEKSLPTYVTVKHLSNYLNSNPEVLKYCNGLKVMFVVGSDSCSGHGGRFKKLFEMGTELIVINREAGNPSWESQCKSFLNSTFDGDLQKLVHFFDSEDDYEIRSTEIRNILKNQVKGDLTKLLHPKVLEYIENNELFQEQKQTQIEILPKK